MINQTRAALAAAFAVMIFAGTSTTMAQEAVPTGAAAIATSEDDRIPVPVPAGAAAPAAHVPVGAAPAPMTTYAPIMHPRALPLVYAPGPGYGSFSRAPKQIICRPAVAPIRQDGCRGIPAPVAGAAVGVLTALAVHSIFF